MASADQVARLLALVPYLQAHPDADLAETARVFRVTPKQLVADLEVLWYCGLPGGLPGDLIEIDMDAIESEGRIRLTNADYLARPMRFTLDEALSLVVGLRAVRELADQNTVAAVDSILAKLELLTGEPARGMVGFAETSGAAAVRDVLVRGIAEGRAVRLTYDGSTRAQTTTPLVDPVGLATRDGFGYLDAWSHERGDWRTFRVDRIADAELTDQPTTDHGQPPRGEGSWLENRAAAQVVRLELDERARWVAEYYPVRGVTHLPGGLAVELLVADPAWLRGLLLRLGPRVRSVEPARLADSAAAAAREALAAYQRLSASARVEP